MANVTICYRNIFETGTTTSTDENTSYPLYRTYDRDIGKLFKFNTHGANLYVKVNQGASSYQVSRLIIPVGHTLNGLNLKLQYSTTGAYGGEQVDALSWAQADALVINKTFAAQTKQYWRFLITSDPAAPPEMPEIYLTDDYVFEENVSIDVVEGTQRNVKREETLSGRVRKIKLGYPREARNYSLRAITAAQKTNIEAWETVYDGTKDFYILDHNGDLLFCENLTDIEFRYVTSILTNVEMDLLQVL